MNELSILTALAALAAAIGSVVNAVKIKEVVNEVKTGNSQTLAQLADAVESRRIDKIPKSGRTPLERSHLEDMKE